MAFWGVEVKPGKPYTHRLHNVRGRLHISQATLGIGSSTKKSLVQCNVGDKSPILLCALLPDKTESCPLDLEFEEDDEVIFSVLGPRSVHLTGYYIGNGHGNGDGDDTDSYGEDIAETEQSSDYDTEEEYEDDFIDDGDLEMLPPSPRLKSGVIIEEILDDEKPANGNGGRKRLKKKYQISDSDGDDQQQIVVKGSTGLSVSDSEEEDGLPISSLSKSKSTIKNIEVELRSDKKISKESKKAEDGGEHVTGLKRKVDTVVQDSEAERVVEHPNDSSVPSTEPRHENPKKKKKGRAKEGKTPGVGDGERSAVHNEDTIQSEEAKTDKMDQDQTVGDEPEKKLHNDKGVAQPNDSSMPSTEAGHESVGKLKKKKKKERAEGKTPGVGVDEKSDVNNEDTTHSDEAKTDKMDQDQTVGDEPEEKLPNDTGVAQPNDSSMPSTEAGHESCGKPKKKKKEGAEGKTPGIGVDDKIDVHNEDTSQSDEAKTDKMDLDQTVGDDPEEKLPNDKRVAQPNDSSMPSVEDGHKSGGKPKKKKKKERAEGKTPGVGVDDKSDVHNEDTTHSDEAKTNKMDQDQAVGDEPEDKLPNKGGVAQPDDSSMPSTEAGHESCRKPKKKKKEQAVEKTPGVGVDGKSDAHNENTIQSDVAKTDKMDLDKTVGDDPEEKLPNDKGVAQPKDSSMPSTEDGHECGGKPKKKKKERAEGKTPGVGIHDKSDVHNKDTTQSDEAKSDKMDQDQTVGDEPEEKLPIDKGVTQLNDCSMPSTEAGHECSGKPKKKKKERAEGKTPGVGFNDKSNVQNEETTHSDEAKTDKMDQDQTVGDELEEKLSNDKSVDIDVDHVADEDHAEAKKKEKKKKVQHSDKNANTEEEGNKGSTVEIEDKKDEAKPSMARAFTNGLVIEELEMGKPEGKKASPGNQVFVHYTGRLKKNGEIFDSNVCGAPFKFRLGVGEVVKGWDIGINGMRVGDKRRITTPPSMGYRRKVGGRKLPPNEWLEFDVELVTIR